MHSVRGSAMTIRLAVFDWAGTLIDHGSRAPLMALLQAFEAEDLPIDEGTARASMGARKRDHVRQILQLPAVAARLPVSLRALDDEARVDRVYHAFTERLLAVLPLHAQPIDGVVEALQALRGRGIAVCSGSGYTRAMMDVVEPLARAAGLDAGPVICADEVPEGRPAPWACFRHAERFGVYPLRDGVKVGDTPADVDEGRNATMLTVAITATGNEVGLDQATLACLSSAERARHLDRAESRLANADHRIEGVAALPALLRRLEGR